MGAGQLLAGNLVNVLIAGLAFLQILPWDIAGFLIIAIGLLAILAYLHSGKTTETRPCLRVSSPEGSFRRQSASEPQEPPEKTVKHAQDVKTPEKPPPARILRRAEPEVSAELEPKPGELTRIGEGDYLSFDLNLEKGEEVVAEVTASGEVNAYILSDENATALDSDQEFWYEAGSESVRNATLRFSAPEDGVWFLIVENSESKEITATAKVDISRPTHSVPFLKAEALELPDARLEGKL